jgi:hypothetical protein
MFAVYALRAHFNQIWGWNHQQVVCLVCQDNIQHKKEQASVLSASPEHTNPAMEWLIGGTAPFAFLEHIRQGPVF